MSYVYLFALANAVVCAAIVFIAVCRLNAMERTVFWRVRLEYAGYVGGAVASGLQPWWGEWPEWGTIGLAVAVLTALLCTGRAWHGDRPPESATDRAPLGEL